MSDDFPVAPTVDPTWSLEIDCGQSSGNSLPLAHQGIPDILAARRHPTIVPHTPRGTEHRCFRLAAGKRRHLRPYPRVRRRLPSRVWLPISQSRRPTRRGRDVLPARRRAHRNSLDNNRYAALDDAGRVAVRQGAHVLGSMVL